MKSKTAPRDYTFIAPLYDHVFQTFLSEGHHDISGVIRSLKNKRDSKILEVGVGSGLTLSHIPSTINYTGIDINERMLQEAQKKKKLLGRRKMTLEVMDAKKLAYKDNTFDLVVAASVITAVDSPLKVMKEMIRVTKKGGMIAIVANLQESDTLKSRIVRIFDPITRKYLGFRTDLDLNQIQNLRNIKLVDYKRTNNILGFPLSSFLLFKKG